ncbi:MAG: 5'/3'-nucleotidase SurE [Tannerella sp.]|jgi:5'-nucleotidase|nr:5'/3'-nucleotidase SurE [Tannerella sp.]
MKKDKPLILITNDDGVGARGLKAITESLRQIGDIVVFAPDKPQSGMSCAITTEEPLYYELLGESDGLTVYSCSGTPVDCVKLSLNEILTRKPDLLVSGINHGGNHALSIHYSGTMGAAFEGCVFEVPSIGISLYNCRIGADFSEACRVGKAIAEKVLQTGLPHGTYLNVNVPNVKKVQGIVPARQTAGRWVREYYREITADGKTIYWLTGDYEVSGAEYPDNDVKLLDEGYATVVPCKIDVTDYAYLQTFSLI